MWFFALIVVVLIGAVAVVASGRWGAMSTAYDDRPDMSVPARQALTSDDIETARFGIGLRGYRMDEVDTLLERVAREVAERDRRIADLERAVTPIMHGPEGAGFAPRHTYDPADFDDTGYQLPILVGGNFPTDTATPEPAPEATAAQSAPEASAPSAAQPVSETEPAPDASATAAEASATQPAADAEAQPATAPEAQPTTAPEAQSVAASEAQQAPQPPAEPEVQQAVQPQAQDDQQSAAQPEAPQAAQPGASAESAVAETARSQVGGPEPLQQETDGSSALEAPLPPVPPEPTLQPENPAESQSWFQPTPAAAPEQQPPAAQQQEQAQQPDAQYSAAAQPAVQQSDATPAAEQAESGWTTWKRPEAQEQAGAGQSAGQGVEQAAGAVEAGQGVVRDQVQGQLWADPGAAAVSSSNGQQGVPGEQLNGLVGEQGEQVGDQAPRGRHSAAPDSNAVQRPN